MDGSGAGLTDAQIDGLDRLARDTFAYFRDHANPENGLVPDSTRAGAPSSITTTGMALACYAVAAERGWISRADAARRVRTVLRTFAAAPGKRGFFFHFLDMETGRRAWKCEVSTIDTTFFLAGALAAAAYFDADDAVEREVREGADALYRAADWTWALDGGPAVSHGWKPESGFLRYRWTGYDEALLLYALAVGSPTHPIPASSYDAWTSTFRWKTLYGLEYLYAGPLFIHQMSHLWIDLRGLRDDVMRARGSDYFENSRRATLVQQRYAVRNPRGFAGYERYVWGISAGDGPGPAVATIDGRERRFWDYRARGVPWGPDDGTLTPWAVVASLPFEPALVARTLEEIDRKYPEMRTPSGYRCSFNPTFPGEPGGWISDGYFGIEQGPIVMTIENVRSGLVWDLMRRSRYLEDGLRKVGFRGGWLDG